MLPPMQNSSSLAGAEPDLTALLRDSVADYCARALAPRRLRALRSAGHSFDRSVWAEMVGLGWCGLSVPEAQGGLGLGAAAVASVCRQLGRVVAAEPVIECGVVAASLLAAAAGQEKRLNGLLDGSTFYTCPCSPAAWRESRPPQRHPPERSTRLLRCMPKVMRSVVSLHRRCQGQELRPG